MSVLRFVDSMTGRLAWPLAAVIIALMFRRAGSALLGRMKTVKWGEGQADFAATTREVEEAAEEAAQPVPDGEGQGDEIQRERLARVIKDSAQLGFDVGRGTSMEPPIDLRVEWVGDQPRVTLGPLSYVAKYGASDDIRRRAGRRS